MAERDLSARRTRNGSEELALSRLFRNRCACRKLDAGVVAFGMRESRLRYFQ